MKKFSLIAIAALVALASFGADVVRYGGGNVAVNSANGSASITNGLYAYSIAGGATATNLELLNPGSYYQNSDLIVTIQAQATAATTTNAVFTFSATGSNISVTNSATTGASGSAAPRGTFLTVTLPLNGTTAVTTNIVLSPATAPAFANGLNVYLESIQMGTGTASLTNYTVTAVQ
jgi:hypothetical protein